MFLHLASNKYIHNYNFKLVICHFGKLKAKKTYTTHALHTKPNKKVESKKKNINKKKQRPLNQKPTKKSGEMYKKTENIKCFKAKKKERNNNTP